ncbi:hypothetical protein GCM10020366_35720 [Saccharopolyspora gregorii]|uniref:Uncharacterized protein n=1 Tax=Saccharopolyspora gregorii TaxID=33914 RepID=A0ABP6RTX0_9PSEU
MVLLGAGLVESCCRTTRAANRCRAGREPCSARWACSTGDDRAATAVALTAVHGWRVAKDRFLRLYDQHQAVLDLRPGEGDVDPDA